MKMTRTSCLLLLALIAFSCVAPLGAQLTASGQAEKARELQEGGHYADALELTERGLSECGTAECRHRLQYTLGYLYQMQSREEKPEAASALLRKSAAAYGEILDQLPAHWPTVQNLLNVYSRLGEPQEAEDALQRGLDSFKHRFVSEERKATFALALGDLYIREGKATESVEAYQVAVDAIPESATPKRRELEAYKKLPTDQQALQIEKLQEWEEQHGDIAGEGYKLIVQSMWNQNPEIAETALLNWLRFQGQWGFLDRESLDGLPRDWAPILDLQKFIVEPSALLSPWWFEKPLRSDALASFFLAVGRGLQEEPQKLLRSWEPTLDLDPPKPLTVSWLELYTEMADLFHRQDFLRKHRDLFEDLQDHLLSAVPDDAIGENAASVMERLHTVLGLIYADMGSCDSSPPERSAVFHLEKAIEYAEQGREDLTEPYQPSGHLRAILAECYRNIGRLESALEAHLDACQSYLDADQLELAKGQLNAANALTDTGYTDESRRFTSLSMVVFLRQYAAEHQGLLDGICSPQGIDWTLPKNLPSDFLTRQRFKIRGDCIRFDNVSDPVWAAAELFDLALSEHIALVGPGDLIRFKKINRVVLGQEMLELEIFDTDQPEDSAFYLRLAFRRPSPGRRLTYVKANTEAVGRIRGILKNPPRTRIQDQTASPSLPAGTLLRIELLATIDPAVVHVAETFPGRLVDIWPETGGRVLPTGSRVEIRAEPDCGSSRRGGGILGDMEEECEWRLELLSIRIGEQKVPIDAQQLSGVGTGGSSSERRRGLRRIYTNTILVFRLSGPLDLGRLRR